MLICRIQGSNRIASPLWARSCLTCWSTLWPWCHPGSLLAAHNIFGVNIEDGVNLVRQWRNDSGIQLKLACHKLAEWVRSSVQFVVILLCVDSVHYVVQQQPVIALYLDCATSGR